MTETPSRVVCAGCGHAVPAAEPYPFRCPRAGQDDADHVLTVVLDPEAARPAEGWRRSFLSPEPHPFLRYRRLFHTYHAARARGLSDVEYRGIVEGLDAEVHRVDGGGFRDTPFAPSEALARRLGLTDGGGLWVKDETGNVSGSHKARHLMGVTVWLEMLERSSGAPADPPALAVASCGNAALAAAVVAKAAGRPLEVFVPPGAHPGVLGRLEDLGAEITVCPRQEGVPGDPTVHRFHQALAAGALPFTCQGNENGLVIEGGGTLAWEMVCELLRRGRQLDAVVVQVGGGALASALAQGFAAARDLGLIDRPPRLYTVQTRGAAPLRRAYERLADRIFDRWCKEGEGTVPLGNDRKRARLLLNRVPARLRDEELRHAATHRSELMWPWEQEPRSLATGILDDETYDWLAVVRAMLDTGGFPVVVSEERLREAHETARKETGIPAEPTGTAGLAGLMDLLRTGAVEPHESVAVLFTGVERD